MATVTRPGDPGYDEAREIFNTAVDRRPARVVRCASTSDVVGAIRGARADGVALTVRAGGHNFGGHASIDGGVVVDLRGLTGVDVRAGAGEPVVVAGTGLRWGDYDAATARHGLATPGGSISGVGVSGFTLGTGLGWLSRRWGLAHDNLIAAELVTADGRVLQVDDDTDPELMWALRGGGGGVGVVTSMTLRAHPLTAVLAGTLVVPIDRASAALRTLLELPAPPPELSWTAVIVTMPGAPEPTLLVNVCSDTVAGLPWLARLRAALDPVVDTTAAVAYPAFQSSADVSAPSGARWDVRSEWLGPLLDADLQALVAAAREARSPLYEIVLRPLGGAIAERAADATAFSFRHADLLIEVIAGWFADDPDPDGHGHRDWMRRTWQAVLPRSVGGADANHLGRDEPVDHVRSAWSPQAHLRLAAVGRRLDPDDVFASTPRGAAALA